MFDARFWCQILTMTPSVFLGWRNKAQNVPDTAWLSLFLWMMCLEMQLAWTSHVFVVYLYTFDFLCEWLRLRFAACHLFLAQKVAVALSCLFCIVFFAFLYLISKQLRKVKRIVQLTNRRRHAYTGWRLIRIARGKIICKESELSGKLIQTWDGPTNFIKSR